MIYILSLSFQLSGALILLLWSWRKTEKHIIDSYYPAEAVAEPDDNDICTMKKERVQLVITDLYRNRCAFSDLCLGYLITIWGEKTFSDCITFVSIIIGTAIITKFECSITNIIAKKKFPEDVKVHSSELEKRGISMTITDKETQEMINRIYNN